MLQLQILCLVHMRIQNQLPYEIKINDILATFWVAYFVYHHSPAINFVEYYWLKLDFGIHVCFCHIDLTIYTHYCPWLYLQNKK